MKLCEKATAIRDKGEGHAEHDADRAVSYEAEGDGPRASALRGIVHREKLQTAKAIELHMRRCGLCSR